MKKFISVLMIFFCISCAPQAPEKTNIVTYFDVEQYFNKEANRLSGANPTIQKEVIVAGNKEQKSMKITDWKTELAMFSSSAINKDSWREEFKVKNEDNAITYTTTNPKIPIKQLVILKNGSEVTGLTIYRLSENYLYRSTDSLVYYPDSLYQIKSYQKIKFLSPKNYQIIGVFAK